MRYVGNLNLGGIKVELEPQVSRRHELITVVVTLGLVGLSTYSAWGGDWYEAAFAGLFALLCGREVIG